MIQKAKFEIGQIVKHRYFDFRGVIFDVDPEFNNTEEWYQSIPSQVRPIKEQPFYHLLAEAPDQPSYVAYVSQQNLLTDEAPGPLAHPLIEELFDGIKNGKYISRSKHN
jgi:heat shock protein HspQ